MDSIPLDNLNRDKLEKKERRKKFGLEITTPEQVLRRWIDEEGLTPEQIKKLLLQSAPKDRKAELWEKPLFVLKT